LDSLGFLRFLQDLNISRDSFELLHCSEYPTKFTRSLEILSDFCKILPLFKMLKLTATLNEIIHAW